VTAAIASRCWPTESEDSCVVNSGTAGLLLEELLSACPDFFPRRSYRHLTRATNLPRRQKVKIPAHKIFSTDTSVRRWIAESTNRRTVFKIANVSIPASKFMGPFAFLPTAK
jgi:hypothetical protein